MKKENKRTTYFTIKDKNILWFIPISSKVDKYQNIIDKKIKKYGFCNTIIIRKIADEAAAILLQNAFPTIEKYIDHFHTVDGVPLRVPTDLQNEIKNVFILRKIVKLRNAVAHNSCVLCDLDKKDNNFAPDFKIVNYLNNCGIRKETRDNKLSNSRIRQITYTLYMFNKIITSTGVKLNVSKDINNLFYKRILLHKEYYNNNELLKSIYDYFDKIIKKHYSINIEENSLT